MLFKGPKSLLDSISNVIKEGRDQYAQEQAEMDKLVAEKMLSPKQKKIAKVAGDPDKMDAADFAALRAGKQVKEARQESPTKGTKKVASYGDQSRSAEVRYNPEYQEYSVHHYKNGSHMGEGPVSYHGGDKEDAHNTAKHSLKNMKEEAESVEQGVTEGYWQDAVKKAEASREARKGKPFEKNPASHDKQGVYKGDKDLAGRLVPKRKEQVQEGDPSYYKGKSTTGNALPDPGSFADRKRTGNTFLKGFKSNPQPIKPYVASKNKNEEVEQVGEATDTPGNGREHQCAIHVKSEQFGEGRTLTTQHAEPDESGNIAWYDVMFDHGIERIMTEDIEILVSEAHTHSKKAMKNEEVSDIEEGRGRPRKNPEDPKWKKMETKPASSDHEDGEEDHGPARPGSPHLTTEPDKHIAVQLKVAKDMHDEKGGADVKFANGKTHFVKHDVAGKVLGALDKLKPSDRANVHDHIAKSHDNLMSVHKVLG
jgi:hypothetical protein